MFHFQTAPVFQRIITNVYLEIQMMSGVKSTDVKALVNIMEFNHIVIVMFKTLGVAALHLAHLAEPILQKTNVKEELEVVFVFILILDNVIRKVLYQNIIILCFIIPWHQHIITSNIFSLL